MPLLRVVQRLRLTLKEVEEEEEEEEDFGERQVAATRRSSEGCRITGSHAVTVRLSMITPYFNLNVYAVVTLLLRRI